MSNHEQPTPSHPEFDVRNTTGKNKQILQDSVRTTSDVDLEEVCEKHYEKLLPIMADKYEYEKRKKEKLEEVKARLDFGDARKKNTRAQESAYSESRIVSPRRQRRSRSPRHNPSVFTRLSRERSRSPQHEYKNKERRESRAPVYNDLREAFLKNYLQQKKCIRDPIVLHNIKQRDGESTEDFIQRYKSKVENVKRRPDACESPDSFTGITKCCKVEIIPDKFTFFARKLRRNSGLGKKENLRPHLNNNPRLKAKRNTRFASFTAKWGIKTDECKNHLRKQIEDMLKAGKLSHIIRELKQNSGKEQPKKKGETSRKEKPQAILMIQSRKKHKTEDNSKFHHPNHKISFPVGIRTFNINMDELSVVRSTSPSMEAWEDTGLRKIRSPINNARNDKVPGYGRNTYAKK
ncbi:hypothetical protein Tco_0367268 [Tanacetum coccineum]